MTGTFLNVAGILIGGIVGLTVCRQISASNQVLMKMILGLATIFVGLRLTWEGLGGGAANVFKQLFIVILALILGRLLGRLLQLQKHLNKLGKVAQDKMAAFRPDHPHRVGEAFLTCTILFCIGPMAILGAFQDGLDGHWHTLGIKSVLDGLATMAFVSTLGWGALLSVIPVMACQGTIALGARFLAPVLHDHALMDSVHVTGGLLVFCIALIIFEVRRIEWADYLPSLAIAPLITWIWS